jgi:peptidoglycan/xylan/chitin deacetylase (PgdA/CDA1 family)
MMLDYKELLAEQPQLWELYSRKEEYSAEKLDNHNRFNYSVSNNKNIEDAPVSRFLFNNDIKPKYPNRKRFAVCLTHDVDDIYPPLIHTMASSVKHIKQAAFKGLMKEWIAYLNKQKKSPYINFQKIISLEEQYDAKSTFYFMATDKDVKRKRYDITSLKSELLDIKNKGWDIGLHTGYYSYDNLEKIKVEKQKIEELIGEPIIGCRNHYLRFKTPETWELLVEAGFKYDTTFGYPDMIGFRNGTCAPFKPYNLNTERYIDIVEIPLNIMDGTLFGYMGLTVTEAKTRIIEMIDTVASLNGVLTVLWHNDIFSWHYRAQWAELYEWLLDYASNKGAWLTSPDELYYWVIDKACEQ